MSRPRPPAADVVAPGARRMAAVVVVAGVLAAIVVSRHTTSEAVSEAAGSDREMIRTEDDLAVLSSGPPPSIEQAAGWLNTKALTDRDLRDTVVLYDFWTFACVNCQHTISHVKAWQKRYTPAGLKIVSIHTPEFEFEADADNVADYVTENGITYPVALDPGRDIWHTWDNHYWPAFYLFDRHGRLRLRHFGEGSYESTEDAIRVLLGVDPLSSRADVT